MCAISSIRVARVRTRLCVGLSMHKFHPSESEKVTADQHPPYSRVRSWWTASGRFFMSSGPITLILKWRARENGSRAFSHGVPATPRIDIPASSKALPVRFLGRMRGLICPFLPVSRTAHKPCGPLVISLGPPLGPDSYRLEDELRSLRACFAVLFSFDLMA